MTEKLGKKFLEAAKYASKYVRTGITNGFIFGFFAGALTAGVARLPQNDADAKQRIAEQKINLVKYQQSKSVENLADLFILVTFSGAGGLAGAGLSLVGGTYGAIKILGKKELHNGPR